ncbi:MAG TPA: CAP domain-containing protein [Thermoanaerobaculia bacterium]|nr:CAP domain-containing protein [Thermoanaerobaculia bacterium]
MRYAAPLLALLLLLLPGAGPAPAQNDLGQELLQLINAERRSKGAPPLRHSPALSQVAQWHTGVISRQDRLSTGSREDLRNQMKRAGYQAHKWTESVATSPGGAATVLGNWRRNDSATFRDLMDPQVRDIGFGFGRFQGMPLYVVIFAEPMAEYIARETMDLRDLQQVRKQIVAAVNSARRKAGVPPVTANTDLDEAAQRHAEDMLARNFFAHESPSGTTVRERARTAGYHWRTIGENIAEGQLSVAEVMETWMQSPGHRRNILEKDFKELGVGLAMGPSGGTHRVLWAQNFGAR